MMETENVFIYMDECVKEKRKAGKESTADLYRASANWLKNFRKNRKLQWEDVTEKLVDKFKNFLEATNLKTNSRNSYLSSLRSMYNSAVKEKLVIPAPNPFTHLKLKREQTLKRALPEEVIERVAGMNLKEHPEYREAVDYFIFSYLACGMPFVDMARLTPQNIEGESIVYNRAKTGVKVCIGITPGMKVILKRQHREGALRLLPILPDKKEVKHETYKCRLRSIDRKLIKIGKILGLPIKLTMYVARHSWASLAQEADVPIAVIKQALGHRSEDTTRFYLAGLSMEKLNRENFKVVKKVDDIACRYI